MINFGTAWADKLMMSGSVDVRSQSEGMTFMAAVDSMADSQKVTIQITGGTGRFMGATGDALMSNDELLLNVYVPELSARTHADDIDGVATPARKVRA